MSVIFSFIARILLINLSQMILVASAFGVSEGMPNSTDQIPLIFVPGFKGSRLVDQEGRTAWVNGLNALGYNPDPLKLPLMWHPQGALKAEDEIEGESLTQAGQPPDLFAQLNFNNLRGSHRALVPHVLPLIYRQAKDGLLPNGPVSNISVIPWLLDEDIYGPFLKEASKWNRPFYAFSYDWRRDNNESALRLKQFVLKVKKERNAAQVDVVCHSMGGLLVFSLMNEDAGLFRKVVFAGTPFHGGVGFMPDMHAGTATGLNKKILSPEVLFSFPSVYSLFPDSTIESSSDAVDANGNALEIDYFKATDWRNFKMGIFAHRAVSVAEEDFLVHALAQAKMFKRKLNVRNKSYNRSMVILGHKFKTLSYMIHGGPKSVLGYDFETHPQVPGDGRVGSNNLPPEYVPYDLFYSEADHGKLLNDPKMQAQIKNYLEITTRTAH